MAAAAVAQPQEMHSVPAVLNYYVVPKDADRDPFFDGTVIETTREYSKIPTQITDFRDQKEHFNLDEQGFQLVEHHTSEKEFIDNAQIKDVFYRDVEQLLKKHTGATRVLIQNHVIRRQSWETARENDARSPELAAQSQPSTSRFVHVDFSPEGARSILEFFLPEEAEKLAKTRWGIINVWKPLKLVQREPLCIADARSLSDDELHARLIKEPVPQDKDAPPPKTTQFKTYLWSVKPPQDPKKHRWYYASRMTPDEALLFKTFDSKEEGVARRVPHSAFETPYDDGPSRESIDMRCFVFWENQPCK